MSWSAPNMRTVRPLKRRIVTTQFTNVQGWERPRVWRFEIHFSWMAGAPKYSPPVPSWLTRNPYLSIRIYSTTRRLSDSTKTNFARKIAIALSHVQTPLLKPGFFSPLVNGVYFILITKKTPLRNRKNTLRTNYQNGSSKCF